MTGANKYKNEKNIAITLADIEALDFIASRLLKFKRIEYHLLQELVAEKFSRKEANSLFRELITKKAIGTYYGSLVILNESVLQQFSLNAAKAGVIARSMQAAWSMLDFIVRETLWLRK